MSTAPQTQIDLAKLFTSVTQTLKENQQSLNETDDYNHNHGDNMLENFQVITQALRKTKGALPSDQLAYASRALSQSSQTSSAQLYSEGLLRAADQVRGQSIITPENAMLLVQALMGGQAAGQTQQPASQPGAGGMDLLTTLLGGQQAPQQAQSTGGDLLNELLGGQSAPEQAQPTGGDLLSELLSGQSAPQQGQPAGGDLLGGLLNAFMGGTPADQSTAANPAAAQPGGIDLNTLLAAGMAFFQARQQGQAPLNALVQAVMTGSQMYGSQHHAQSGQLVAGTLLNTIASMVSGGRN